MTANQDPSAAQLRAELRNRRGLSRRTQKQVAQAMDWSTSKILRIENGAVGTSITDLRALLDYYDVGDEKQTAKLIELARAARIRRGSRPP